MGWRDSTTSVESAAGASSTSIEGIDELAAAIRTLRTTDEVTRFLRDLCTRAELEALAHRWQTAQLLDEGVPYLEIAERVPDLDRDRDAGRAVGQARRGRIPDRARAGEAAMSAFTRAGENGRLTLAVPAKGRMAEPTLRLLRRRGSLVRDDRAIARRAVCQCARRPPARAAERHPRVRPGRRRAPRGHRREPRRRGAGRRPHARGARVRPLHAAGRGAERRAADGDRRSRRAPRRDGLSRLDEDAARRARDRGRARPGLGLGRGDAAPRARRCDRRSRLDRLDGERERAAADRHAALVPGRPDRRARSRSRRSTTSSSGSS